MTVPEIQPTSVLKVNGNKIVDANGNEVLLRGAGLGGWMNMENFITGYPGHEYQVRKGLRNVLGEEKYKFFFDKFLEYFFTETDAKFFKSLGLNALRVLFNYRHFEDDMNPGVYKEEGFKWLDRIINICAAHGIYTILDLHAAPGAQNIDWHADGGTHRALFWEYKEFQDRAIKLWEVLAARYRGNGWVAGHNPLNEPTDEEHYRVIAWYERAEKAIRAVDPDHILFWDGNTWAADSQDLKSPCPTPSMHATTTPPWASRGTAEQNVKLQKSFDRKVEFMRKHNGPIWNGEFGPVYANAEDGDNFNEINQERYNVLGQQLKIYDDARASWRMVYTSPDSPYMTLLKAFLQKKKLLSADEWGTDDKHVRDVMGPLEDWFVKHVPSIQHRYPQTWPVKVHVARLVRNILLSEELVHEYAEYFRDLTFEELDGLAGSFKLEICLTRDGLNKILTEHSKC
ncbi:hypothetical protein HDV00_009372 [Rhizophlyctis rosea]|nr:hypothetical protein HDV00_009372 [Rhizophlyctis rosea]